MILFESEDFASVFRKLRTLIMTLISLNLRNTHAHPLSHTEMKDLQEFARYKQ